MKRGIDEHDDRGKRPKGSLTFLAKCLCTAHLLSDAAAWRAAKAAAASEHVDIISVKDSPDSASCRIQARVTAPSNTSQVASTAHTCEFESVSYVQLVVDTRSGELLDADTSCCPGGYHAVRGSLCPCVSAAVLAAAQLHTLDYGQEQQLATPHWAGTDALVARGWRDSKAAALWLLQQPGSLRQPLPELLQRLKEGDMCPDSGAGSSWAVKVNSSVPRYDSLYQTSVSADRIRTLQGGATSQHRGLNNNHVLDNVPCDLPGHTEEKEGANAAGGHLLGRTIHSTATGSTAGSSSSTAGSCANQQQLLAALGGSSLTCYMGKPVPGWYKRPQVINWAFSLLLSAGGDAQPATASSSRSTTATVDGKPFVVLTGLMRVLWTSMHMLGLPSSDLRPVLMVAMALRNLLLGVVFPVWVRKAVDRQLQQWQEGISEVHATAPATCRGEVRLVHLLRVLTEAQQLSLHGWDHPTVSAALHSPAAAADGVADQQPQGLQEVAGLLRLRLHYLELLGAQQAYLDLAMASKQWSQAVSALLRSGDRSKLQMAAEMLPRHIKQLPQRLEYMQQLLDLEDLGVVERLELAARLLLSLHQDLQRCSHRPTMGHSSQKAWWEMQAWQTRLQGQPGAAERLRLGRPLLMFVKAFIKMAGEMQFSLAKGSLEPAAAAAAAGGDAATGSSSAAAAATGDAPAPEALPPAGDAATAGPLAAEVLHLPEEEAWAGEDARAFERYRAYLARHAGDDADLLLPLPRSMAQACAAATAPREVLVSPDSPLELDRALLQNGEPSDRSSNGSSMTLPLDGMGFVAEAVVDQSAIQVKPFPLPDLLPLCGLAPASLHTLLEKTMAPFFDDMFLTPSSSGSSSPAEVLLQVADCPAVEFGGPAVRLQMALEMVVHMMALHPLVNSRGVGDVPAEFDMYVPLLEGLLAMGQRGLAWTVARVSYRTAPSRQSALYLLLIGIAQGYEHQRAAVDWILGIDSCQQTKQSGGDGDMDESPDTSPRSPGPRQQQQPAPADSSSIDTAKLLGQDAAEAISLADTASSRARRKQQLKQAAASEAEPQQQQQQQQHDAVDRVLVENMLRDAQDAMVDALEGVGDRDTLMQEFLESLQEVTGCPAPMLMPYLQGLDAPVADRAFDFYDDDSESMDDVYGWRYGGGREGELADTLESTLNRLMASVQLRMQNYGHGGGPGDGDGGGGGTGPDGPGLDAGRGAGGRPAQEPTSGATKVLEHDLLGVTGRAWRQRAEALHSMQLGVVVQFAAGCGLAADLVQHLGLVLLGCGAGKKKEAAVTWEQWAATARSHIPNSYGMEVRAGAGGARTALHLAAWPGASVSVLSGYMNPDERELAGFAAWLLHWLQVSASSTTAAAASGPAASSGDGAARAAGFLRQLALLLKGRCYGPWQLWVAAALGKVGEPQVACEVASQGLLPSCCDYANLAGITAAEVECFKTLMPLLEQEGAPHVLEQVAVTQLLFLQEPVPAHLLQRAGVLKRVLTLWPSMATSERLEAEPTQLRNALIDQQSGTIQTHRFSPGLNTWHPLLQRCVLQSLATCLPPGNTCRDCGQALLAAASSPIEAASLDLLREAMSGLHYSVQLYTARLARMSGLIRSWQGLVATLAEPLTAAADEFGKAESSYSGGTCTTMCAWKADKTQPYEYERALSQEVLNAGSWVNGCLAWVVVELQGSCHGTGPVPETSAEYLEHLSSCLLGFHTPHVLLYAAAALKYLGQSSNRDITCQLLPNGVLPLAGHREDLQRGGGPSLAHPWSGWADNRYTTQLAQVLSDGELMAALPPTTVKHLAVTYWIKTGAVDAMVKVSQLLKALDARSNSSAAAGTSSMLLSVGAGPVSSTGSSSQAVDLLSIEVHPFLAPYLELAPSSGAQAAIQRFIQLQGCTQQADVWGALGAVFGETREALATPVDPARLNTSKLSDHLKLVDGVLGLMDQAPYASSPAVSWLKAQPLFQHVQRLLSDVGDPVPLGILLEALSTPLLRLRVLQYKIWKTSSAICTGTPPHATRVDKGPAKYWEHQVASSGVACPVPPTYSSKAQVWAQLPDAELRAAWEAAHKAQGMALPAGQPINKPQQAAFVLGWLARQEVDLAWALLKYVEVHGGPLSRELLAELRTLAQSPCQLGQLPVFLYCLGEAVRQDRTRYSIYAVFRPVKLPRDVHQYCFRGRRLSNREQLQRHLANKFNRVQAQQLMVAAIPWLGWASNTKALEISTLAGWLWWLAMESAPLAGILVDQEGGPPRAQARHPPRWLEDAMYQQLMMDPYGYY